MNHRQKNKKYLTGSVALGSIISAGLALLSACSSEPESHVVSSPPPAAPATQIIVAQPAPAPVVTAVATPSATPIIVMQAPPAPQQEVVLAQPTPDHKWVAGYWTWRNERYEWVAGHWEVPPSRNSTWVVPHWEHLDNGGYRFYEGYWN